MAASVDADRQREIEYLKEKLIAGGVDYDAFKEKLVANTKRTLDMFQEDHDKEPNPCLEATRIKMAAKIAGSASHEGNFYAVLDREDMSRSGV